MAAYNPIPIEGGFGRTVKAMEDFGDSLKQARQFQEQKRATAVREGLERERADFDRQKYGDETKRQRKQDLLAVLSKADQLVQSGDADGAHNLLTLYGLTKDQQEALKQAPGGLPSAEPAAPPPGAPIQGGSALPDGVENAQRPPMAPPGPMIPPAAESDPEAATRGPSAPPGMPHRQGLNPTVAKYFAGLDPASYARQLGVPPRVEQATDVPPAMGQASPQQPMGPMAAPPDSDALAAPAAPMEKLRAASLAQGQEEAAINARRAATVKAGGLPPEQAPQKLTYRDEDGNVYTLDPGAEQRHSEAQTDRVRARNLAAFDGLLPQLDPELQKYVSRLRPAIALNDKPLSSNDIMDSVTSMMNRDAQMEASRTNAETARAAAAAEKEKDRELRLQIAKMTHRGGAGGGDGLKPDQRLDNDRQTGAEARQLLNTVQTRSDYTRRLNDYRDSVGMLKGLESDNPAEQRAALGTWAKQKSGPGAVQQAERNEFVNVVGGKNVQLRKWLNEWAGGGEVPPEQTAIFADAVRKYELHRQQENLGAIRRTVSNAFGKHPNPALRPYEQWATGQIEVGDTPAAEPQPTSQQPPQGPQSQKTAPGVIDLAGINDRLGKMRMRR